MEKFFVEKNTTSLPQEWQEAGDGWSNNAIIKIYESENDFLKGKKIMLINQKAKSARYTAHEDRFVVLSSDKLLLSFLLMKKITLVGLFELK